MDLYFFHRYDLYVRRHNGPLYNFDCYRDLNFVQDREDFKKAVDPAFVAKLAENGFVEATSGGQIGLYSYKYLGLHDVDVSDKWILHDRFLTDQEIEQLTPKPSFQNKAVFKCRCHSDYITQELPREIPGYGPMSHTFWSATRFVEFWVDPDQKDVAEAALRAKGWKDTINTAYIRKQAEKLNASYSFVKWDGREFSNKVDVYKPARNSTMVLEVSLYDAPGQAVGGKLATHAALNNLDCHVFISSRTPPVDDTTHLITIVCTRTL